MSINTAFNQWEILDRSSNLVDFIELQLLDHMGITKSQNKKVKKIMDLMYAIYQEAGVIVLAKG